MHRSRFYETAEVLSEKVLSKLIFFGENGFLKLTPEGDQKIVG
jgi:hypothetical protein